MNKIGEWLVQYILPSTGLHMAVGKYPNKRKAIAAAYLALAIYIYIDECGETSDNDYYSITPLFFLEGGEDLGINIMHHYEDGTTKTEATCALVKILDDDSELW